MATIAVDFDGVIHSYEKGWHDGTIYGRFLLGAVDGLRYLMRNYSVFVHTTRNPDPVASWIAGHSGCIPTITEARLHDPVGTFWNTKGVLLVTNRKLAAIAYIDDRGIRFHDWAQALDDLNTYTERKP